MGMSLNSTDRFVWGRAINQSPLRRLKKSREGKIAVVASPRSTPLLFVSLRFVTCIATHPVMRCEY